MAVASTPPLPAALAAKPGAAPPSRQAPGFLLPLRARRAGASRLGPAAATCSSSRRFRVEAIKTQREKQQTEVPVSQSFPAALLDGMDDPMVPSDESWVVKLEQSVNIFLTDSVPDFLHWRRLLGCRILHLSRCFTCMKPLAGGGELII